MLVKDILKNKWNDYPDDSIGFISPDEDEIYILQEGTGENLSEEDTDRGYVDYWISLRISSSQTEIDSGQWMETKLIRDINYTIEELINRMKECDAPDIDGSWTVMDDYEIEMALQNN